MVKVYLNDIEIWSGWLFVSLNNFDDIVSRANEQFGVNGWTSIEYIKDSA